MRVICEIANYPNRYLVNEKMKSEENYANGLSKDVHMISQSRMQRLSNLHHHWQQNISAPCAKQLSHSVNLLNYRGISESKNGVINISYTVR